MKKTVEKYQVFVFLILIIMILTVAKVKYGNKSQLPVNSDQLTVEPTLTTTPTINKDYPLQDKLPYQGKGFVIEKYVAPMTLNLKLTTATQQQAAKDIGVWLDSFGEAGSGHIIELEEATATGKLKPTRPTGTLP